MKRDDVSSLQRSNQIALAALETARGTAARLGEQEERLRNTEKNLDIANFHHKIAVDKTRELKTLNRSMFAVHVSNPFTKGKREAQLEQAVLDRHREERDISEGTRRDAFLAAQQTERDFKEAEALGLRRAPAPDSEAAKARRKQLMFDENDSEEEQMEKDIDEGLDQMSHNVGQLRKFAEVQGTMVERSIGVIDRLDPKVGHFLLIRNGLSLTNHRAGQETRRGAVSDKGPTLAHSLMACYDFSAVDTRRNRFIRILGLYGVSWFLFLLDSPLNYA